MATRCSKCGFYIQRIKIGDVIKRKCKCKE